MAGKSSTKSAQHELVTCNLEFPRVQKELLDLEDDQFAAVSRSIEKIEQMTWDQVYKTSSASASMLNFSTLREIASSVRSMSCLLHETAYLLDTAAGFGSTSFAQPAPIFESRFCLKFKRSIKPRQFLAVLRYREERVITS